MLSCRQLIYLLFFLYMDRKEYPVCGMPGRNRYIRLREMENDFGKKIVRFYDLDGNLIEVGTPM